MDVRERVLNLKNNGTEHLKSSLLQKAKLFAWKTGLGPVLNVRPDVLGQQAVFYFPGRSGKISCACYEHNGAILLALTEKEVESIRDILVQNPGVELWLRNGWFTGTVRLLSADEQQEIEGNISDEQFFGFMLRSLVKPTLKDHCLLEATRSAPCTGTNGPGSKAWVWPLATLLLLFTKRRK